MAGGRIDLRDEREKGTMNVRQKQPEEETLRAYDWGRGKVYRLRFSALPPSKQKYIFFFFFV